MTRLRSSLPILVGIVLVLLATIVAAASAPACSAGAVPARDQAANAAMTDQAAYAAQVLTWLHPWSTARW